MLQRTRSVIAAVISIEARGTRLPLLHRSLSTSGRRRFDPGDIPSTLRHYFPGVPIDISALSLHEIEKALKDLTESESSLRKQIAAMRANAETIRLGSSHSHALQLSWQGILMLSGLHDRSKLLKAAMQSLKLNKESGQAPSSDTLKALQPYFNGKTFEFSFDPPFGLLTSTT